MSKSKHQVWFEGNFGKFQLDSIGNWSEAKLEILKDYLKEYSLVLTRQSNLEHYYIDAFSGAGIHVKKDTGQYISGSPLNALDIEPPFKHYFFVDANDSKIDYLRNRIKSRSDVTLEAGDCNKVLLEKIFPKVRYEEYKRALCFVDPYGLHIDWKVIQTAGKMRSVELFINFSVMDINMNMVRNSMTMVDKSQIERMNRFWGDESWHKLLYSDDIDLFGSDIKSRVGKAETTLVNAYRKRLREVAGFKFVPMPVKMLNDDGHLLYFLFFATHNKTGYKIANYIFKKFRNRTEN